MMIYYRITYRRPSTRSTYRTAIALNDGQTYDITARDGWLVGAEKIDERMFREWKAQMNCWTLWLTLADGPKP